MCRMLGVVAPGGVPADLFSRFRGQASEGRVGKGMAPGHRDGWGIVRYQNGEPSYAGRSAQDAAADPEYLRALGALRDARGVALGHLRKASAGARDVANSHPFVEGRWAFCHNGTVWGVAPPGESDSRALFARLLASLRAGAEPEAALEALAREVDASCRYTSLTCLLTDGRGLWGLRKVGNDPVACADDACPAEYYTLGVARVGGATVVSQEHEFLGLGGAAWAAVPDGGIVSVDASGAFHVKGP